MESEGKEGRVREGEGGRLRLPSFEEGVEEEREGGRGGGEEVRGRW